MVCVPCFIIPLLLFIWHRFIQPYVLRFYNPWAVTDSGENTKTEFPFTCEGGVCMFGKKKIEKNESEEKESKETLNETNDSSDNKLKAE